MNLSCNLLETEDRDVCMLFYNFLMCLHNMKKLFVESNKKKIDR